MSLNYYIYILLIIVISYFIGNICAAYIISKILFGKDIRESGSKNPGTTNMTRVYGIKYGLLTFLFDFLKGFICVLVVKIIFANIAGNELGTTVSYISGLFVIIGHNYPILLGFKGGKGFASAIGIFFVINPSFTGLLILIGIPLLLIIDRVSVCALLFFIIEASYYVINHNNNNLFITLIVQLYLLLSVIAHLPNIKRLIKGDEKALELKKKIFNRKEN